MTVEWLNSVLREAKAPGVALFVVATVYVCAWARRMEGEAEAIRLWPPLRAAVVANDTAAGSATRPAAGAVELTVLSVESE